MAPKKSTLFKAILKLEASIIVFPTRWMNGGICIFNCTECIQLKRKQIEHQQQRNYQIKTKWFCQNTF